MISKGFQDDLTLLEMVSNEPCVCKAGGIEECRSCYAQEELDHIYDQIKYALEDLKERYALK